MTLWFVGSTHHSDLVHLKHWLEQILSTIIKSSGELIIAWIVEEGSVLDVALVDLDVTALIAHHELLEREEAEIPTITFSIGDETGNGRW